MANFFVIALLAIAVAAVAATLLVQLARIPEAVRFQLAPRGCRAFTFFLVLVDAAVRRSFAASAMDRSQRARAKPSPAQRRLLAVSFERWVAA